jgi:hypothetical protein
MSKRKADALSAVSSSNGIKKVKQTHDQEPQSQKTANLLDDSDSASDGGSDGGVNLGEADFKVNTEYARRFEHNKKREEMHKCKSLYTSCA